MKKLATVLVATGALIALSGCVADPYYGNSYYGGSYYGSGYGGSGYGSTAMAVRTTMADMTGPIAAATTTIAAITVATRPG